MATKMNQVRFRVTSEESEMLRALANYLRRGQSDTLRMLIIGAMQYIREQDVQPNSDAEQRNEAVRAGAFICNYEDCKNPAVIHYCEEHDQ